MHVDLSQSDSIVTSFSDMVVRFPGLAAVVAADEALTYAELDARSDGLAMQLVAAGAGPGTFVGVAAERAVATIVAMLGILKAGAAYVPLSDTLTRARLDLILRDASIAMLLGMETSREGVVTVIPEAGGDGQPRPVLPASGSESPAYVMYTSGSTGMPKGVVVPHRGVLRLVRGQTFMQFGPDERILLNSPLGFDASTLEIWGALLNGGTLVIPDADTRALRDLGEVIARNRITSLWLTAGLFHAMADERPADFRPLRQLVTGGDVVSPAKAARVLAACPDLRLVNGYGPTENTTFTCCHVISHEETRSGNPLPIGLPVNGTGVHIVDEALHPVADGEAGELCASGRGLALGYLNQPGMTAEKFVPAPWDPGLTIYRTGDLCRQDADGVIHYIGRIDNQVKIRGFRVELGAIEAAAESFDDVGQAAAVAVAAGDSSDKAITLYYTGTACRDAIAARLTAQLEPHEIPARYILLDALPLNDNGKVDRRALAAMEGRDSATPAPRGTGSLILRELAEILSTAQVDPRANFFDLGASSLHIARLHERLQSALDRVFPISDLFRFPSTDALADHLEGADAPAGPTPAQARAAQGDIAIIGMAGRFPGARSVAEFWQAVLDGRELISHFTEAELEFPLPDRAQRSDYVLARGIMPDTDLFDARHFGIPPREAERMDPQHRILLEVAQTALEEAGVDPERFPGRIGIFAGSSQNSYLLNNLLSAPGAPRAFAAGYPAQDLATLFANDKDFLVTRIAYKLNLKGPAVTVLTACSTSLVAVGQGCDALRTGAADMVLAGGVSITFPARRASRYTPDGMISRDGHCRTFDADATGTTFGDGAGMVVLRRLEDALAEGDEIIAVIRGHAINNDGADKVGYAAPSINAQADVIRAAHAAARVTPDQIGYVEAHGTGTPLGDPIEFAALTEAFGASTGRTALGSAKPVVGHLDIAAGITGLIKTALTVRHGIIPPLVHFCKPNPRIDFDASPFYPVTERTDWAAGDAPRRAGVSAFGVGGTNIHMILEEAPAPAVVEQPATAGPRIFPVTATSPEALKAAVADLGEWAARHPEADPDAVAETLRLGRRHFPLRTVLVAEDMDDLATAARAGGPPPVTTARHDGLVFLFPGQGAQHVGMARDLYVAEPVFRDALDQCADLLRPELGCNLFDVIHASGASVGAAAKQLTDTRLAQPAIFSVSYALARQWEHWGIRPDVLIGHSVGEFAAATLAGVMDLPDALRLVALRGRLISALPRGAMLSVRASEEEVAPYLADGLDLAAVNGPKACVLAAPEEAVAGILPRLEADGITVARLQTSHAFHSRMMDPALAPFREAVAATPLHAPRLPILSTVTGDWLTEAEITNPEYWAGHMRRPVRFFDALCKVRSEGTQLFLECGPGRNLTMLAGQDPDRKSRGAAIASLPHAQAENTDSARSMREAFGLLWAHGHAVDWSHLDPHAGRRPRASGLPTYPFQRKRFWVEPAVTAIAEPADAAPGIPAPVETAAKETVIDALRSVLADLSGLAPEDMPADAGLVALGFDSLLMTQVTRGLSERFGVTVTLRQLVDGFDTIGALADYLEANCQPVGGKPAAPAARDEVPDGKPMASSAPMTVLAREVQELTPAQRDHIAALTARFTAKTAQSKALTAKYRPFHADPRTASGFNRLWKEITYQIVTVKSRGSRLIDVDGNEYVDLLNGFGPGFLGHSPDHVVKAVEEQLHAGFEVGPQNLAAMEASELFCQVTGNDRASFVCTGSEAVYGAMRVARTVTGRDRIVIFARDYHGNFDEVLVRGIEGADGPRTMPLAPGIPRDSVKNIVVLPYGTPESLDWIRRNADSLAAVIAEPVQSRRPEFRPAEFIREVRRITERSGTLFVFDEVVTGFRFGPRGAQSLYGVEADLVTYGKVVGGGMPVGVVAGKAGFMDTFDGGQWDYGDDSFPSAPVTFFAGTFVRHPLAMASLRAMLTFFKAQPDFFWKSVNAKGDRLAGTLDRWFTENDMPFQMPNFGSLMYLRIGEDQRFGGLLGAHMRDRGVFLLEGFPSYMTAAHDEADIVHAIAAFKDSALEMRSAGLIPGREEPGYAGPRIRAVAPRLSLPGGEAAIAESMANPVGDFTMQATLAQREIWSAIAIEPEVSPAYNESVTLRLKGAVDRQVLEEATRRCFDRHDAFRSSFPAGEVCTLRIAREAAFQIAHIDLTAEAEEERVTRMNRLRADDAVTPFDLANGPLARASIVALPGGETRLTITAHHIICDGASLAVILNDIAHLYAALASGHEPTLPSAPSIVDYALAEEEWAQSATFEADRAYWLDLYGNTLPLLDLPVDHPRQTRRSVEAARIDLFFDHDLTRRARAAATARGTTFANFMTAVFGLYLARITGGDDIPLGVPAAGQAARGIEGMVGHCVNLMPLRIAVDRDQPVTDYLRQTRRHLLDALEHQHFGYGSLVHALRIGRDAGRVPLVPVMFNIERAFTIDAARFGAESVDILSNPRAFDNFDIFLNLTDDGDGLLAEWTYQTSLFDAATIRSHMAGLSDLLERVIDAPDARIGDLLSISDGERQLIARAARGPDMPYPAEPLHRLIERMAAGDPDRIVLEAGDGHLSYAEVDARANRIAAALVARGIRPGDPVGVALSRRTPLVAALLGVLKAGGAYVPLDPAFPLDRLNYILANSGAVHLVIDASTRGIFGAAAQVPVFDLDRDPVPDQHPAGAFASVDVPPQAPAYILYTSGSTGRPKGVPIPHAGFINFITAMIREPGLTPEDRFLAASTVSFDIAGLEIWGPLLTGGTIVLVETDTLRDPTRLRRVIEDDRITIMQSTPTSWQMLIEDGWPGRKNLRVLVGGEPISPLLARALVERCGDVWNMYGPTETTVWSTMRRLDGKTITVGQPIANMETAIYDAAMRPVPPGVVGELFIGGAGIGHGYCGSPELTAERFLPHPERPGALIYRTGDLARWVVTEDGGEIDCLGRIDGQIKLHGFRIELGEIETVLQETPGILRAVVQLHGFGPGDDRLVAWLVAEGETPPDHQTLRLNLASRLPYYMVPARFEYLPSLPLMPNGKVNRRALADTSLTAVSPEPALPDNGEAGTMRRLFAEILAVPDVTIDDDFFELGGHSLLAVKLFARIRRDLDAELPISTLLTHPTARMLVARVAEASRIPAAADPLDASWDTTVVIHPGPGTARRPLFIAGGVGGNVNNLRELGRILGRERPVVGLQTRGIMGHRRFDTIEEMAADHLHHMRAHQPQGPYLIAGYSGGSYVAFEIVRQLEAAGEAVGFLGILDMDAPDFAPEVSLPTLQRAKLELGMLRAHGLKGALTRTHAAIRGRTRRLREAWHLGGTGVEAQRLAELRDAWPTLRARYRPAAIRGDAWILLTEPDSLRAAVMLRTDPELGWQHLVLGTRTFARHDAGHLSVLVGDNAETLGQMIFEAIEQAGGT